MSKKMKVTNAWSVKLVGGFPSITRLSENKYYQCGGRVKILWSSDYAKMRRAWRLVEKLATAYTNCRCGGCWNCEARRIVGKK